MTTSPMMITALIAFGLVAGCKSGGSNDTSSSAAEPAVEAPVPKTGNLADKYAPVKLTADLSKLTDKEREMVGVLIEAAAEMDSVFWQQAYGDKDALLGSLKDPAQRRMAELSYGPWDRLAGNQPFVEGTPPKPAGAGFYPADVTKAEIERYIAAHPDQADAIKSLYTVVRRTEGKALEAVPYSVAFADATKAAADKLEVAATLAEEPGLKRYLELRAKALRTDDYRDSDLAWMDMKDNRIDVVIGPIETYEDQLFGYKAAHEAYVLIKDMQWSKRLSKYTKLLPDLQRGLPVPDAYKKETPGSDSDLNAYDVVYYAGDCNAGSKTIAINLPNDETVQLEKGTRRLQLKNAIKAKFEKILVPIAGALIAEDQIKHITFAAFFDNIMFHEVAHGLGIKNTIDGKGTVREALKELSSSVEEGKADILGLHMIAKLYESGELTEGTLEDRYVTFMAGIFRSVRFGASSAHGRANMLRFNFFEKMGAFKRDPETGRYRVDLEKIGAATAALTQKILTLQGDGDYDGTKALMAEMGSVGDALGADLAKLSEMGIPVDVYFEQGTDVLGL